MTNDILVKLVSDKLGLPFRSVQNTVKLLDEGATIPFISRYRKEATGSLDEVAISDIKKSWNLTMELIKRKEFILKTIADQDQLSGPLEKLIQKCWDPVQLEDIYLPYKKKRKTRATMAKEKGLQPLADLIWGQNENDVDKAASKFINDNVPDIESALQGARDIIAERINEDREARAIIRKLFRITGTLISKVVTKKKSEAEKFKDYFDYQELARKAPAHRVLAIYRGEKEGLLKVSLEVDIDESSFKLNRLFIRPHTSASTRYQMELAIEDAYKRLLKPSIETEFKNIHKDRADDEAVKVFYENLRQLLLAPPLGNKTILGLDPGFRTGCKLVCLDATGALIYHSAIFPHPPQNQIMEAQAEIDHLVNKYQIEAIAIGNGTAGKETYAMVKGIKFERPVDVFMVSESGASVYSASEIARKEFPDHDVTVRGAVSIGRRLMDPLSELVKIDPKSIGVGQYQHDVNQSKLKADLERCVESCVNAVGINLNSASEHVLTFISGLGSTLAKNIVLHRNENGPFTKIEGLKKVPRMGSKSYEQCAGFLRIRDGQNLLDNTGVHPERYALVDQMAKDQNVDVPTLLSSETSRAAIQPQRYISEEVGAPTITDIIKELSKPGLDMRGAAKTFDFTPGVNSIDDIQVGMMVNGIINNVTKFGAFVDIGIKDSGLIHVSQMSDRFVRDPLEVVKLNQEVVARVIDIDVSRKRISLSLKTS